MSDENQPFEMNSLNGKKALALVREADFAHPGDKRAIEMVFKHLPRDPSKRVLDVGSGLGATADLIRHEGWGRVTGIDQNRGAVVYANETYPRCHFVCCDVSAVDQRVEPGFPIVVSFCAFYAFRDQGAALAALARVATPEAKLALFDYVDRGDYAADPILEDACVRRLLEDLQSGAWDERYGRLRALEEADMGYRLVVVPPGPAS